MAVSDENMVTRVARAIAADLEGTLPNKYRQRWEEISPMARDTMLRRARAAIEAMREPTKAMWHASVDENGEYVTFDAWSAMIDAALASSPSP